jgi:hypothetical protein
MDIKVFIASHEATCGECGKELSRHSWITLAGEKGPICLECADLDHLMYLPSGNAALTRRSTKYSTLKAVVLKWSRARKRYERQGILVEEDALAKAEQECLTDADAREQRRLRDAERRARLDELYVNKFAQRICELFPGIPDGREQGIAEFACMKYRGQVGRSASAKELDEEAVMLAVIAHIRHTETQYDELLDQGMERWDARDAVKFEINDVLALWRKK